MRKRNHYPVAAFLLLLALLFGGCSYNQPGLDTQAIQENTQKSYELTDIPAYAGNSFVILDDNKPAFSKKDRERTDAFETYSDLDELGRCGVAYANICKELMPTEERGAIGMVKPTGWHTVKYDNVEGKYLYNRCHLIGYQLAGENANEKNLITGTRRGKTQSTVMRTLQIQRILLCAKFPKSSRDYSRKLFIISSKITITTLPISFAFSTQPCVKPFFANK